MRHSLPWATLPDSAMQRELLGHSRHQANVQPRDLVKATYSMTTLESESHDVMVRRQLPAEASVVIRHSPGMVAVAATEAMRLSVSKKAWVPLIPSEARDAGQPWLRLKWVRARSHFATSENYFFEGSVPQDLCPFHGVIQGLKSI